MSVAPPQSCTPDSLALFLSGDIVLGRGIDQILPNPGGLQLFEPCASSAATYVELAERASGRIPKPASFDYV